MLEKTQWGGGKKGPGFSSWKRGEAAKNASNYSEKVGKNQYFGKLAAHTQTHVHNVWRSHDSFFAAPCFVCSPLRRLYFIDKKNVNVEISMSNALKH